MKIANYLVLYSALIASTSQAAVIAVMDGGSPTLQSHTTVVDKSTGGDNIGSMTGSFSADVASFTSAELNYWNNTEYDFEAGTNKTATWTFSNLTVGSKWDVFSTWLPAGNRSTAAPYTIQGGLTIPLNQQSAPTADLVLNDGTTGQSSFNFKKIGDATVGANGNLIVTLQSAASGYVIVDAIALKQTAVPEPSSAALLGLGGLALVLRRRK
jgi:hypothetical protein